jgi:hypothetical protein
MRKAAFDAGMIQEESSAKLVLCLEPEAACMACEEQRLAGPAGINVLMIGDSFMVTTLWSPLYILLTAYTALNVLASCSPPIPYLCFALMACHFPFSLSDA